MESAEKNKWFYWTLAGGAAFLVFLYYARNAIAPFAIAYAFAYLLDPLVDKIESKNFPRTLAIVLLLAGLFGFLFVLGIVLIPLLQLQVHQLVDNLPNYIGVVKEWIKPLLDQISGLNAARVQQFMEEGMQKFGQLPMKIIQSASTFVWKSISGLLNVLLALFNLIVIPVVMFYLLRDFDEINRRAAELIPPRYREKTLDALREIDQVMSKFVRGQLMVATLMALLYSAGLYLSGTPLSLFIGAAAGYANLVPYLGLVVGFIPAVVLSFLQHQEIMPLVGVALTFGVVQSLEGMVITPKIVGDEIGLHPVIIMLAVLVGAEFFGILGIVLAVPATAALNVLFARGLAAYKKSKMYR